MDDRMFITQVDLDCTNTVLLEYLDVSLDLHFGRSSAHPSRGYRGPCSPATLVIIVLSLPATTVLVHPCMSPFISAVLGRPRLWLPASLYLLHPCSRVSRGTCTSLYIARNHLLDHI